ncbi:AraC family transcriptional regulator ligand-binding domain-containing protein [Rhodococcus triatomae]
MADLICASSLSGVPELIKDRGGDPSEFLGRVGIDSALVGKYETFIPLSALSTLLGLCAQELDTADFALRLAARQDLDILGPVAIAARNAETVGDALRSIAKYAHVYSPALSVDVMLGDPNAICRIDTILHKLPYRAHVVELALGLAFKTFQVSVGSEYRPALMMFQHPRIADRQTYTDFFGCSVEFGREQSAMLFPRGLLYRRLPQVDPLAHDVAVRFMARRNAEAPFSDAVSTLIVRSLPVGAATLEQVSSLMSVHPRTMQRRLAGDGKTFESILDDSRRELAIGLLANVDVPLSAISRQLGYSAPSTLTRSCKRWFSMGPLAKRRDLVRRT